MKTVDVRGLRIGEGIPKICVSLMGNSVGELKQKAEMLKDAGVDLAEWRVDWFDDWSHPSKVLEALNEYTITIKIGKYMITRSKYRYQSDRRSFSFDFRFLTAGGCEFFNSYLFICPPPTVSLPAHQSG